MLFQTNCIKENATSQCINIQTVVAVHSVNKSLHVVRSISP